MGTVRYLRARDQWRQKGESRDGVWQRRLKDQRAALRHQWEVEEARLLGQIAETRTELSLAHQSIRELTEMLVKLAQDAANPESLIREFGTQLVRITQGDSQPAPNYENLADLLATATGEEDEATAGGKEWVPDHELEILEWANEAMPGRGGFFNQEKEAGARDQEA